MPGQGAPPPRHPHSVACVCEPDLSKFFFCQPRICTLTSASISGGPSALQLAEGEAAGFGGDWGGAVLRREACLSQVCRPVLVLTSAFLR